MNNYKKGFVIPLVIAIIALLGIGGGAYVYVNNKSAEKIENSLKEVVNNGISTTTTQKDTKEVLERLNDVTVEDTKGIRGFSFKIDDLSIVHPFTKNLIKNKNSIKESDVKDSGGSILYKNTDEIIVEFKRHHCCGGGERYSLYVYANKNSDLITAITFDDEYKTNEPITINYIKKIIPNYTSKIKPTMPILQQPPTDVVSDGYYYASVTDWDQINKELEIDFLTLSNKKELFNGYTIAFDILMSETTYFYSTGINIQLENNSVNKRRFKVSDDLATKIKLEGIIDKNINSINLWKDTPHFIKINDGRIIEVTTVSAAG